MLWRSNEALLVYLTELHNIDFPEENVDSSEHTEDG
ncbi:MAG: hypothetical protein ACJARG_000551 [Arcticibacterium sp.]|jgi:hypothetical protein